MQLLADMFGKKIIINEPVDASAMGAAIIGIMATGKIKIFEEVKEFSVTSRFSFYFPFHFVPYISNFIL